MRLNGAYGFNLTKLWFPRRAETLGTDQFPPPAPRMQESLFPSGAIDFPPIRGVPQSGTFWPFGEALSVGDAPECGHDSSSGLLPPFFQRFTTLLLREMTLAYCWPHQVSTHSAGQSPTVLGKRQPCAMSANAPRRRATNMRSDGPVRRPGGYSKGLVAICGELVLQL